MGASFVTLHMDGNLLRSEVTSRFRDAQEDDLHENGHSYSGGIGMARGLRFENKSFATVALAEEWLADHAKKYGPAVTVHATAQNGTDVWIIGAWCSS